MYIMRPQSPATRFDVYIYPINIRKSMRQLLNKIAVYGVPFSLIA